MTRVYDYWLGGTDNFQADRDLGRQIIAVEPSVRAIARANRDFIGDAEQPAQLVAALRDALAPGSYLVLCHAAEAGPIMAQPLEKVYNLSVSGSLRIRSGSEILPFFEGFELVDPGLVSGPQWRPDAAAVARGEAGHMWGLLAGVGRKP
jgi:hypothetical protein